MCGGGGGDHPVRPGLRLLDQAGGEMGAVPPGFKFLLRPAPTGGAGDDGCCSGTGE